MWMCAGMVLIALVAVAATGSGLYLLPAVGCMLMMSAMMTDIINRRHGKANPADVAVARKILIVGGRAGEWMDRQKLKSAASTADGMKEPARAVARTAHFARATAVSAPLRCAAAFAPTCSRPRAFIPGQARYQEDLHAYPP